MLEGHALVALEEPRKVVGGEACRSCHLRQGERLTEVLANERERAARAAVLTSQRGPRDRALDVGNDAPVGIDDVHHRLCSFRLTLHGGAELVEALLVERPRREERLGETLEPRLEVGAHRFEPVSTMSKNCFDVLVEPRREQVGAAPNALRELAAKGAKV